MLFESRKLRYTHPGQNTLTFPDIQLDGGESILVLGKSGSGKTTLLNLFSGLLVPEEGEVLLDQVNVSSLKGAEADMYRGKNIGIVFQKPHLLAPLNVKENLEVACHFSHNKGQDVSQLLQDLGIGEKVNSRVQTLSEGESQRVSIARALITKPKLILADEPTSSLDDESTEMVVQLLRDQAAKIGAALIIVTHDHRVKNHISNFIEVKAT